MKRRSVGELVLLLAVVAPASPAGAPGCAACHRAIAEQFARTPMALSCGPVQASAEPAGDFYHARSDTRYQIEPVHGELDLRWPGGRVRLDLFIGSGRTGRSYAWSEDSYFYEAPAGYYAIRHAWDAAPGYQEDTKPYLDRPLTGTCLFCHAGSARLAAGTVNRIPDWRRLRGVTCERCHGDATQHAAHPLKTNVVNPARLPAALRDAVCEQCHLAGEARVSRAGRKLEDFRPGEPLSDYLAVYLAGADSRAVSVNGHAESLARSRCRQSSAQLWCGTCHDPHQPLASTGYRQKCLECHATRECPTPVANQGDCVACHMPKSRAYDGGHTTFTDHSIPRRASTENRRPEAPANLLPYYRSDVPRDRGLAWFQVAERHHAPAIYDRAWPLLRQAVASGPGDSDLYTYSAYLLQRDGNDDLAVRLYRQALALDAGNAVALANLGDLLYRAGKTAEAAQLWNKALRANPRQAAIQRALERLSQPPF